MKIDNFALTMHQACPRRYQHRMIEGHTLRRRSAALGFGGTLHNGLAVWYRNTHLPNGERLDLAVAEIEKTWDNSVPVEDYRTMGKCVDVMQEYAREYPEESFKVVGAPERPIVEVTFTLPTGMYLPCTQCDRDSGGPWASQCSSCSVEKEPIQYGGIFDGLIEFGPKVYVFEHKSTSQLGTYYFNQFKPNNQVTGYIWAATQLSGLDVAGAIVNAIGVYKSSKTKFERQVTTRNKELDIPEWLMNVYDTCVEIKHHERTGRYPQRTPSCTQYGLCEFHQVCTLPNPEHRAKRLEQDYIKSNWDYTKRDENANG